VNFCTRCLKRSVACECPRRRARPTSVDTIPAPMLTDAEVSAEKWARLNAQDDSQSPTQVAAVAPPST
jgi:hypothetical protein